MAQQITGALSVALSPEEKQRVEKKATERRRRVQPLPPRPLPREQVVRGGRAEGDRVLRGRPSPRIPATRSRTPAWPTPTSCSASGSAPSPPVEYLAQAKAMALKALEMDDTLAEAHTSLAYARWLGDLDWPTAEREFKRALELKSSYVPGPPVVRRVPGGARPARRSARGDQARPAARPALRPGEPGRGMGALFRPPLRRGDRGTAEDAGDGPRLPGRPPGALVGLGRQGSARGGDRRYPEGESRAPGPAP